MPSTAELTSTSAMTTDSKAEEVTTRVAQRRRGCPLRTQPRARCGMCLRQSSKGSLCPLPPSRSCAQARPSGESCRRNDEGGDPPAPCPAVSAVARDDLGEWGYGGGRRGTTCSLRRRLRKRNRFRGRSPAPTSHWWLIPRVCSPLLPWAYGGADLCDGWPPGGCVSISPARDGVGAGSLSPPSRLRMRPQPRYRQCAIQRLWTLRWCWGGRWGENSSQDASSVGEEGYPSRQRVSELAAG